MNGTCDFDRMPGRLAFAMCKHEHKVGVWVCDRHALGLDGSGEISCRVCTKDLDAPLKHWCPLTEVPA